MTDEAMAEEYRKQLRQRLIDDDDFERLEMFDENVEEAFLAGLKAGKAMAETDLAKEIILKLYNAGRDVLMCRTEEKAYDNLSKAINDRSIEQFLKEI